MVAIGTCNKWERAITVLWFAHVRMRCDGSKRRRTCWWRKGHHAAYVVGALAWLCCRIWTTNNTSPAETEMPYAPGKLPKTNGCAIIVTKPPYLHLCLSRLLWNNASNYYSIDRWHTLVGQQIYMDQSSLLTWSVLHTVCRGGLASLLQYYSRTNPTTH